MRSAKPRPSCAWLRGISGRTTTFSVIGILSCRWWVVLTMRPFQILCLRWRRRAAGAVAYAVAAISHFLPGCTTWWACSRAAPSAAAATKAINIWLVCDYEWDDTLSSQLRRLSCSVFFFFTLLLLNFVMPHGD